jgi:hypothetical protein
MLPSQFGTTADTRDNSRDATSRDLFRGKMGELLQPGRVTVAHLYPGQSLGAKAVKCLIQISLCYPMRLSFVVRIEKKSKTIYDLCLHKALQSINNSLCSTRDSGVLLKCIWIGTPMRLRSYGPGFNFLAYSGGTLPSRPYQRNSRATFFGSEILSESRAGLTAGCCDRVTLFPLVPY